MKVKIFFSVAIAIVFILSDLQKVDAQNAGPFIRVAGTWSIKQFSGFTTTVTVTITQHNKKLTGFANQENGTNGTLTGFVDGENINLIITWYNGTKGHYTGTWKHNDAAEYPFGYFDGQTIDMLHPESKASWNTPDKFKLE